MVKPVENHFRNQVSFPVNSNREHVRAGESRVPILVPFRPSVPGLKP